jgi:hypothetical protein
MVLATIVGIGLSLRSIQLQVLTVLFLSLV